MIGILMSTYNGETYLREQIDSILRQKEVNIRLYIRDDGSTDKTTDIIREYEDKDDRIRFINKESIINTGIKESFFELLRFAYKDDIINYFSFADQDDVWVPEKLFKACEKLLKIPANPVGKLYFSNKIFVNKNLEIIRKESISWYNDFIEALWKCRAAGCTMVFDRNLASYVLREDLNNTLIHDAWIYRIAKSIGTTIVFDEDSYILYRQHGNNAVGLKSLDQYQYHESVVYWFKRFIPDLFGKRDKRLQEATAIIYEKYNDVLTEEARKTLKIFRTYRWNPASKVKLILNKQMRKRPKKDRVIWAYRTLFNWL